MTFDEVFSDAELGDVLAVSNGKPQPTASGLRLACWQSHNFTGPLRAKIDASDGQPRKLEIEARNEGGVVVAYRVADGDEHTFTLIE